MSAQPAPVLIVGGGMAGLTTAWELQRRGIACRVIEATPHRGGRICSIDEQGGRLETGMEFYYGAYREARRLLKDFGLLQELVPIKLYGRMVWQGRIQGFSKTTPWLKLLSAKDNFRLQFRVAKRAFGLLTLDPFDFKAQDPLDQIDVAQYFGQNGGEAVLELAARPMVNSYAFCEPEGHSLAMFLRILKLGAISGIFGLRPGNDALPKAMAQRLDVLEARAVAVAIEAGRATGVEVEMPGGGRETLPASQVVVAVGGPWAAELFRGSLPGLAQQYDALSYSTIVLANLHLDRPLEGREWTYIHSRKAGHQSAFAIDLARRSPAMFPHGKAMLQTNFASPVSDALLAKSDDEIAAIAIRDMETFLPGMASWVKHTSVVRRPRAHPNYSCGMFAKIRAIQAEAQRIAGLHLAGDYLRSPLCEGAIRSALQIQDALAKPFAAQLAVSR